MIHTRLQQWSDHRRDGVMDREDVRVLAEVEKARALDECARALSVIATTLENKVIRFHGIVDICAVFRSESRSTMNDCTAINRPDTEATDCEAYDERQD